MPGTVGVGTVGVVGPVGVGIDVTGTVGTLGVVTVIVTGVGVGPVGIVGVPGVKEYNALISFNITIPSLKHDKNITILCVFHFSKFYIWKET